MTVLRRFAYLLPALVLAACTSHAPDMNEQRAYRLTMDWVGRYQGTLPCPDCDGIESEVQLYPEGSKSGRGPARLTERDSVDALTVSDGEYR